MSTSNDSQSCPRCGSTKIVEIVRKKPFDAKKAIIGGLLTGGAGVIAGFIGSKQACLKCIECGCEWMP